ncbi:hypothetical protein LTR17_005661 [Elasticomyces elasticus]|nr:hypothetical protein LTR17_005661 [Elasticomyces elasticus]
MLVKGYCRDVPADETPGQANGFGGYTTHTEDMKWDNTIVLSRGYTTNKMRGRGFNAVTAGFLAGKDDNDDKTTPSINNSSDTQVAEPSSMTSNQILETTIADLYASPYMTSKIQPPPGDPNDLTEEEPMELQEIARSSLECIRLYNACILPEESARGFEEARPKDLLSSLPPELLTMTLAYLPVKEIVRAKWLSHHFNDCIAAPESDVMLYKKKSKDIIDSIRSVALPLLLSDEAEPVDFLSSLIVFLSHRGIHAKAIPRTRDILTFCRRWQTVHEPALAQPANTTEESMLALMTRRQQLLALSEFVDDVVDYNVHCHAQRAVKQIYKYVDNDTVVPKDDLKGHVAGLMALVLQHMTAEKLATYLPAEMDVLHVYTMISYWGLGRAFSIVDDDWELGEDLPAWPLTRIKLRYHEGDDEWLEYSEDRILRLKGICTISRLRAMLGWQLPHLPSTHDFAYCVRSEQAYLAVKYHCASWDKDANLSWKTKATILEHLYFY